MGAALSARLASNLAASNLDLELVSQLLNPSPASSLLVNEAARQLQVDTSRIRHRLGVGRLVGWKDRGSWRLPAWQFAGSGVLPGLETVLAEIPSDQPALVVAAFMTTLQEDLLVDGEPATPRDWLLAGGDPRRVADLASVLGTPA